MNSYDAGDVVRCSGTFKDPAGVLTDPTTVTLKIVKPDGTVLTYTYALGQITKDSVGVYHRDEALPASAMAGVWIYRFEGTGLAVAEEDSFYVRKAAA